MKRLIDCLVPPLTPAGFVFAGFMLGVVFTGFWASVALVVIAARH